MKKIIKKITFISIILIFVLSAKVFATSSFRIMFQDGKGAKVGETIEIPIIIDSINIEGAEKNIYYFTANLEIDEDSLELVAYENDEYIKVNEELKDYGLEISYNAEEQKLQTGFSQQLINKLSDEDDSSNIKALNNYLEIGTIKLKVKDGTKPDSYLIGITNVEGGNSEIYLDANDRYSVVEVYEDEEQEESPLDKGEDESKSDFGDETIVVPKKKDDSSEVVETIITTPAATQASTKKAENESEKSSEKATTTRKVTANNNGSYSGGNGGYSGGNQNYNYDNQEDNYSNDYNNDYNYNQDNNDYQQEQGVETTQDTTKQTTKQTTQETEPAYVNARGLKIECDFENNKVVLNVGDSTQLKAVISPDNANNKSVEWESNREDIATVDENGKVKAVGKGKAIIVVKSAENSSVTASIMITVN